MFSERLKEARVRAGLSQAELAREVGGISRAAVSALEAGTSKGPRPENLAAMAMVLGVDIYWLATGKAQSVQNSESPSDSTGPNPGADVLMLAELIELFQSVDGYKDRRRFLDSVRALIEQPTGQEAGQQA